jgi:hypothetical protein
MHDARNQYNMSRSQKAQVQVSQSQNPNRKDAAAAEKSAWRLSKLMHSSSKGRCEGEEATRNTTIAIAIVVSLVRSATIHYIYAKTKSVMHAKNQKRNAVLLSYNIISSKQPED